MAGIELDGVNQKVVLDADGDTYLEAATDDTVKVYVAGAQDFTITANTLTANSGSTIAAQALTATTVTASGIVKTDDATDATSTTDGSLQTDGGLSVAKDTIIGNDLKLLSDSAVLVFGSGSDATLTHTNDVGLTLNSTNKLMFNDATQFIQGASGTVLNIAATDEIDLTATAVDLNGTLDVSGISLLTGRVGVVTAGDLGTGIHVRTADSGAGVDAGADELVLENSGNAGLSIASGNTSTGTIIFSDDGGSAEGFVQYKHDDNYLRFGTGGGNERVRIASDGEFFIGSSTSTNSKLMVTQAENKALARFHQTVSDTGATLFKIKCDNSTGGDYVSFNIDRAGNSALNIAGTGNVTNTNNSYGAISDERIKKDITDAKSQWNDIKALKIKNYKLKTDDESPTQLGVIAQDLETDGMGGLVQNSRPEAYLVNSHSDFGTIEDGTADNGATPIKDDDGKITGYEDLFTEGQKVKSVKYSVLYMKAIKCLQEAITEIESLKARVTTLEG